MAPSPSVKQRRRGADLEHAILEVAWAELAEHGYAGLTMEGVASRAGTSRTVLARRWDGKTALAVAAIRHQMAKHPLDVVERGELRAELLQYLDRLSGRAAMMTAVFSLLTSEQVRETYASPQELRQAMRSGGPSVLTGILERAAARGEIDRAKLIPAVVTLLEDLCRHHAIMNLSAPPAALRQTWVDHIFLPLVKAA